MVKVAIIITVSNFNKEIFIKAKLYAHSYYYVYNINVCMPNHTHVYSI